MAATLAASEDRAEFAGRDAVGDDSRSYADDAVYVRVAGIQFSSMAAATISCILESPA
jgi:hypothetical protein